MDVERKRALSLYADRVSRQWIVMDVEGNFWTVSISSENPWAQRQPFYPTAETELEPVPGHYKSMLGIPA